MERAQRRHQTNVAIARQVQIARAHGQPAEQRGRYKKHRAMDCGNPHCGLCGNQRHLGGKHGLSLQELSAEDMLRHDMELFDAIPA